jgi:hypothetical protein
MGVSVTPGQMHFTRMLLAELYGEGARDPTTFKAEEFAVSMGVGFFGGMIGGGVGLALLAAGTTTTATLVASAVTTLFITAPAKTATDMLMRESMNYEQKTGDEVLQDVTTKPIIDIGTDTTTSLFTPSPYFYSYKFMIKTMITQGAKSLIPYLRDDPWWVDPIYFEEEPLP